MATIGKIVGPLILLAVVVGVIWRLDENGWGSLVWLALVVAMQIIRAPFARQTSENTVVRTHRESIERLLLAAVAIGSTPVPIVHLLTGLFGFADYDLPHWATAIGAAMLVPGLWLFWRSHRDLGRNWSVTTELRDGHTLVTEGVYARVRHPMYTAIFVLFAAVPLLIHNAIAGFGGLAAFAVMYVVRVPYEETMMREQFGAEYDEYLRRSHRLVPLPGSA